MQHVCPIMPPPTSLGVEPPLHGAEPCRLFDVVPPYVVMTTPCAKPPGVLGPGPHQDPRCGFDPYGLPLSVAKDLAVRARGVQV